MTLIYQYYKIICPRCFSIRDKNYPNQMIVHKKCKTFLMPFCFDQETKEIYIVTHKYFK